MWLLPVKYRLLGWVSLFLLAGFLTTTIGGYLVSRNTIRDSVARQSLPLTGDNIYSEIQKDLLRPVFISSLMAHDTFVRDWILAGEQDKAQIVRYLKEVKERYGTITSFLVSAKTHKYYYAGGTLKSVQAQEPRDKWFFRVAAMPESYETNVDFDLANRDTMTIFINYRVLDYDGKFIAATGVGLALDTMSRLIDSYQERFHRRIYFVDAEGKVVMAGKAAKEINGSIRELPGLETIAAQILTRAATPTRLQYKLGAATVLLNSRYISELGWYLIVEQDISEDLKPAQRVFAINLGISAAVTLLVLAITLLAVRRHQAVLERAAATDSLTGLLNRQALELMMMQAIAEVGRSKQALSALLLDVDFFKQVNDRHGHLVGDRVLQGIAAAIRSQIRESDVAARWGGEEFLILLKDCPLAQGAALAEKLRLAIAAWRDSAASGELAVTASLGVAEYRLGESQESFFARADAGLYLAKSGGRNRSELAPEATTA